MTKTIKFAATNSLFEVLRDKTFEASIFFVGNLSPYENTNMHKIMTDSEDFLFDIQGCMIDKGVFLHGVLQRKNDLGRVVVEIL